MLEDPDTGAAAGVCVKRRAGGKFLEKEILCTVVRDILHSLIHKLCALTLQPGMALSSPPAGGKKNDCSAFSEMT